MRLGLSVCICSVNLEVELKAILQAPMPLGLLYQKALLTNAISEY